MLRELSSSFRSVLGESVPLTLRVEYLLGGAYVDLGRFDEAIERLEGVVERSEEGLGDDHYTTLLRIGALADAHRMKSVHRLTFEGVVDGNALETSEEWAERALVRSSRSYGETHALTLHFQTKLATVLQERGDPERTIDLLRPLITLLEERYEPDDPEVLRAKVHLSKALTDSGRHEEALPLLVSAAQGWERKRAARDLVDTWITLAYNYTQLGQDDLAFETGRRAYETAMADLPTGHWVAAMAAQIFAAQNLAKGDTTRAGEIMVELVEVLDLELGSDHPRTQQQRELVIQFYLNDGNREEAALHADVLLESTSPDDPHYAKRFALWEECQDG